MSDTIERRDATAPSSGAKGLSGFELLQRMVKGDLPPPPFAGTTNIRLTEVEDGRVVFTGTPTGAFLNPLGTVHGGWIATIIESALGCAVHSKLQPGQTYTTTAMTVNYVRALLPDSGEVRCEGVAVHSGRRTATSEARLVDAKGRPIAHGSETCLIMDVHG
jgi:uncharacterized protein (TIGR00369 family)